MDAHDVSQLATAVAAMTRPAAAPAPAPGLGEPPGLPRDDYHYTGDVSTSPLSMDYYRSKVREFQSTLNALDETFQAVQSALASGALTAQGQNELIQWAREFQSKRLAFKATAETINAAAATVNALGGRLQPVSLPPALAALPLMPLAAVAAFGTAAVLVSWGVAAIRAARDVLETQTMLELVPEAQRADVIRSINDVRRAEAQASGTGIAAFAPVLKWGAIALVAFLAYRAFAPMLPRANPVEDDDTDD